MNTRNGLVTFRNTHVKPYNRPTEDMIINYPEKTADEEITVPLNHLEIEKPRQQGRPRKSHFTNDLMDKTADIFMSHRERADYKLALKLQYEGVITTPGNPFE